MDQNLRIWSWEKDTCSKPLFPNFKARHLYGRLAQGELVLDGSRDDTEDYELLLFDVNRNAAHSLTKIHPYLTVATSSRNIVAWSTKEGTIELYQVATGRGNFSKLGVHPPRVSGLAVSPDGTRLVSSGRDQTLRMWDLSTGAQILLGESCTIVRSIEFSPDGMQIATSWWQSNTIQIWDLSLLNTAISRPIEAIKPDKFRFSPTGEHIAAFIGRNSTLSLYDANTGAVKVSFVGHVGSFAFSHDSKQLASVLEDDTTIVWDILTGSSTTILSHDSVSVLAFSPDGKQLASGALGSLRIWNLETGDIVLELKMSSSIQEIVFSLDGTRLAWQSLNEDEETASTDIRFWDLNAGHLCHDAVIPARFMAGTIAISPNGTIGAYQSRGGTVLCDLASTETRVLANTKKGYLYGKYLESVTTLVFSRDNRYLASSFSSGVIELWSIEAGRLIGVYDFGHYLRYGATSSALGPGLSISADQSYIESKVGQISTRQVQRDAPDDFVAPISRWRYTSQNGGWLMEGTRKMLWIPPDYGDRGRVDHHDGTFAFCHFTGVVLLKVAQGEPVADSGL